jgi:type I restriction enzyme S subunit
MMITNSIKSRVDLIDVINSKKTTREKNLRDKIKKQEWFFTLNNLIPTHWLEVNFMDVTWLITCGVAKRPTYIDEGVPFLSAQNVRPFKTNLDKVKKISEKEFKKLTIGGAPERNDVLYTRVGNCGEAAKINYEFEFGIYVSLTLIKPIHELINSDFLVAFLNSHYGKVQANRGAIGIGLKNLNVDNVRKFKVPIPPLPEQQAIVAKIEELLSELDNGKQQLLTAQQQLKVYRQSLLKWAFEGKLTNKNVKEGVLPKGWKKAMIEEIATVGTGATPLKGNNKYYENGKIAWVTSGALNDEYVKEATDYVTEHALKETNLTIYPKHTLLLAMYGEGKTRGKCSELLIDATTNQAIAAIHFKNHDERVRPFLKYFLLKNYNDIRMLSSGGVQPNLNLGIVKKTTIPFPTFEEQQLIVSELESKLTVCDKIEETISQSLQQAETLRLSILKKAFEGRLI